MPNHSLCRSQAFTQKASNNLLKTPPQNRKTL
eukprot:Gb_04864 [translate_table: standard]